MLLNGIDADRSVAPGSAAPAPGLMPMSVLSLRLNGLPLQQPAELLPPMLTKPSLEIEIGAAPLSP